MAPTFERRVRFPPEDSSQRDSGPVRLALANGRGENESVRIVIAPHARVVVVVDSVSVGDGGAAGGDFVLLVVLVLLLLLLLVTVVVAVVVMRWPPPTLHLL